MQNAFDPNRVSLHIAGQKDRMAGLLNDLASIETPSRKPALQGPVFDLIRKKLETLGFHVLLVPGKTTGGYLFARPKQRTKHAPVQLLIGHCDTVWPEGTIREMPVSRENGKMKGPGVFDMKAGLVQIIFAIEAIRELRLPCEVTPVVLINSDEEIGSHESTCAIKRLARVADRAYVLEPPLGQTGKLKTARKGVGRYTITVKGEPAHAGLDPGKGASAIIELSHQVQRLFALNDAERGITVNVGMIEGGISPNVIAPESRAVVDVRVLTHEDARYVEQAILDLKPVNPDTEVSVDGGIGRPPMEYSERNQHLWRAARNTGRQIGLALESATAGGGSDGNTTSMFCATLDGLGAVGDGAHARHEFIFIDKLVERTILLTLLMCLQPLDQLTNSER